MQRRIRKKERKNMGSTQKNGWGRRWVTSVRNRIENNSSGNTEKESDMPKQFISKKNAGQGRTGDVHQGRAVQRERHNRQPQQQLSTREDEKNSTR